MCVDFHVPPIAARDFFRHIHRDETFGKIAKPFTGIILRKKFRRLRSSIHIAIAWYAARYKVVTILLNAMTFEAFKIRELVRACVSYEGVCESVPHICIRIRDLLTYVFIVPND